MTQETKPIKVIRMTKQVGSKWEIHFPADIRQVDINYLRRYLGIAFSRFKRTARIERRKTERALKETLDVNG